MPKKNRKKRKNRNIDNASVIAVTGEEADLGDLQLDEKKETDIVMDGIQTDFLEFRDKVSQGLLVAGQMTSEVLASVGSVLVEISPLACLSFSSAYGLFSGSAQTPSSGQPVRQHQPDVLRMN